MLRPHARAGLALRRAVQEGDGRAPAPQSEPARDVRGERRLRRRDGPRRRSSSSTASRPTRAASASTPRSGASDQEAAYESLRAGRARLRPPPRLPRTRGATSSSRRRAPRSRTPSTRRLPDRETVNDLVPAVVLEASPQRGAGDAAPGRGGAASRATASSSRRARWPTRTPTARSAAAPIIRLQPTRERRLRASRSCPRSRRRSCRSTRPTARSCALVGGFDYNANKFNHVTQAWRQPGSSFKPFIYSAALEKGFTPATVLNDAPFVIDAAKTGGQLWEPKNYDGKYEGPMRLRTALAKSKNMVSIRMLQAIGTGLRAGLHPALRLRGRRCIPPYLTMALGAGLGHAAADGARLCGVRQRRLSREALVHRAHRGQPRQGPVLGASPKMAGDGCRARARRSATPSS